VTSTCQFLIDGSQFSKQTQIVYVYGILVATLADPIAYGAFSQPISMKLSCSTETVTVSPSLLEVPIFPQGEEKVEILDKNSLSSYFSSSDPFCPVSKYIAFSDSLCSTRLFHPQILFDKSALHFTPIVGMLPTPVFIKATTDGSGPGGIL
jgi:hypothetical protein